MQHLPPLQPAPSIWHNRAFTRLWLADLISNTGSQITALALPLTAAVVLGATPVQMGMLTVAGTLPNLLFGLLAGVWIDRTRRRPILIGADLGRALLLGSIPLAVLLHALTFIHLLVVTFAAATLTILFQIASVAVLPAVVHHDQLVDANSKLALSGSVLSIAGPSAAGGLIQIMSAPKAIIVDALSYVLSALSLREVSMTEPAASKRGVGSGMWREIQAGIRALVRTPILRALTLSGTVGAFGGAVQSAVLVLFFTRDLGLTPATLGVVYTCGGLGALLGSVLAGRTAGWFGMGRAIVLGNVLWALGIVVIPLAGVAGGILPYLIIGEVCTGIGATIFSINQMSLRQHLTPVGLLGRVTAARRFLLFSMTPLGAALGGVLGGALGLRATLVVGAVGFVLSLPVVIFSPVRQVQALADVPPMTE